MSKFERDDLTQEEVDGYMIVGYNENGVPLNVSKKLFWKAHGLRKVETLNAVIEHGGVGEDNVEYYSLQNSRTGENVLSVESEDDRN